MNTLSTSIPISSRKPMDADEFVKIWKGELEVIGTEWEENIKFDNRMPFRSISITGIQVEEAIILFMSTGFDSNNYFISLILNNCQLYSLDLSYSNIHSIEFNKSEIYNINAGGSNVNKLSIRESICNHFIFAHGSTLWDFFMENSRVEMGLISNTTIGDFQIAHSSIGSIKIGASNKFSKFQVLNSQVGKIEASSFGFIGLFRCHLFLDKSTLITLENGLIAHLDLESSVFPEFTTFILSNCEVNRISLINFFNYGSILFSGVKPKEAWEGLIKNTSGWYSLNYINQEEKSDSVIQFIASDLGKTLFINCNLQKFNRFEFSNTKMLDVFLAESNMPDDKKFCLPNNEENSWKTAQQKRLAYGQFKKIYEAQGDIAGSLRYLAFEMDAYREQLKQEKIKSKFSKEWWCIKRAWDNRSERFMLYLNKFSTNYGNNWHRGFWVTIAVMSFCFFIYCLTLGFWFGSSWSTFFNLASYAPQYLNPFRDGDSIIPTEILPTLNDSEKMWRLPLSRIIDYVSRIFVAYFVYQTIQAFRKLGKSSG